MRAEGNKNMVFLNNNIDDVNLYLVTSFDSVPRIYVPDYNGLCVSLEYLLVMVNEVYYYEETITRLMVAKMINKRRKEIDSEVKDKAVILAYQKDKEYWGTIIGKFVNVVGIASQRSMFYSNIIILEEDVEYDSIYAPFMFSKHNVDYRPKIDDEEY